MDPSEDVHYQTQVTDLYSVSIDTLRYYEEIGIVVPERDQNQMVIATTGEHDFERLNITVSLLDMDFSLGKIPRSCSITIAA